MRRLLPVFAVALAIGGIYLLLAGGEERPERTEDVRSVGPALDAEHSAPELSGRGSADATRDARVRAHAVGDLSLAPGEPLRIRGRILSPRGPLAGADLLIFPERPNVLDPHTTGSPWASPSLTAILRPSRSIARTTTGSDGRFEIAIERRRRARLGARAAGFAPRETILFAPTGGDPPPLEILLRPGHTLGGTVVRADGSPVVGARLHVRSRRRSHSIPTLGAEARTDSAGRFSLAPLPPGSMELVCSAVRLGTVVRRISLPTQRRVTFRYREPARVEGSVFHPAGTPSPNATVTLVTTDDTGLVGVAEATTDAAGRFVTDSLAPGRWTDVRVRAEAMPERRAVWGDLVLPPERPSAAETLRLDLVLHHGATLAGRVRSPGDGTAGANAVVALVRLSPHGPCEIAHLRADDVGSFRFTGLATGGYALIARAGDLHARWPDDWTGAEPGLRLHAGVTRDGLVLSLRACGCVVGRVAGAPTGGSDEHLARVRAGPYSATCALDAEGRFAFPAVPACPDASVRFWDGSHRLTKGVAVIAGRTTEVILRIPEGPRIRGVVKDPTGQGIEGAYVGMGFWSWNIENIGYQGASPGHAYVTDAQGRFDLPYVEPQSFADVDAAEWRLVVEHPDYEKHQEVLVEKERKIPTRERPAEVEIELKPLGARAALRGRVIQAGGRPAAAARVVGHQIGRRAEAVTGSDGRFVVEGLHAGALSITAQHGTGRFPPKDEEEGAAGGHYDAVPDEVVLTLEAVRVLEGVVVDADGHPIDDLVVSVRVFEEIREDEKSAREIERLEAATPVQRAELLRECAEARMGWQVKMNTTTRDGGRFRFEDLPPGPYGILVLPTSSVETGVLHTFLGPVDTNAGHVVVALPEGEVIHGRITDDAGGPVPGATVIGGYPALQSWGMSHTQYRPLTRANGDGSYRLTGLAPGRYEVIVAARGYEPRLLEGTPTGTELNVALTRGEAVRGRLLRSSGEPLAGLALRIGALDKSVGARIERLEKLGGSGWFHARGTMPKTARTDAEGRFTFEGLIPGRYRVRLDRAMVRAGQPILPKVEIETGDPPADIVTAASHVITGRVLGADGEVPPSYHFGHSGHRTRPSVEAERSGRRLAFDFVDAHGRFEIGGIADGPVTLVVDAGSKYEEARVPSHAGARDVEIRLTKKPEDEESSEN